MTNYKSFFPLCREGGLLITNNFISTMLGISKQNANYIIIKYNLTKIYDDSRNSIFYRFDDFDHYVVKQSKYYITDAKKNDYDLYKIIDEKLKNQK